VAMLELNEHASVALSRQDKVINAKW